MNDHLASYLRKVGSLKSDNQRLDNKIQGSLEKKGPQVKTYFKTIEDLKAHIFASSAYNVCIIFQTDNACLAADGFRVKY